MSTAEGAGRAGERARASRPGVPAPKAVTAPEPQDPPRELAGQAAEVRPIDGLVDRLGAQPALGLVGKLVVQPAGGLCRRRRPRARRWASNGP